MKVSDLFTQKLKIISLGIEIFAEELRKCQIEVLHLDWHPPAGGNKQLLGILEQFTKNRDSDLALHDARSTDLKK